ncbi:hypothetical protein FBU59_006257 [Linderina macrospora]|uniref:Uncharacterized protein n=1 Tax=Linderina macrospora TaxID=4868 RepID=A0ACC1J0I5_9FUNG|nr:hypothetical protein FBU59_006257 [Linderina macrospora]
MHDKAFGSPLGRTPGSTHSASTNAWPYNKTFADFRQFSATGGKPADLTEPVDGTLNVYHALSTASVADGQAVDGSPSADSTSSQVAAAAAQYAVPSAQTYLSADAQKSMSSDEKKDVFDITRKAVSALLSLPLEGSDVSGVAGWLGQDNTPLALLDADEVKETVAATSQIVVRQREQQIRRQQELREGGVLAKRVKSQMGIVSELASSEVELSYSAPGFVPLKSEPPALYPLPPGDDDEEEDEEEEDEEEEDEEEEEEDDGTSNL